MFEKIVNTSSTMCLDSKSMGKLFDLMIMGFRYQVLQCCQPSEILHVTMKHLETLRETIDHEQTVLPLIAATEARLVQMCQGYRHYDY